jgi:hypothetical protein
MTAIWTLPRTWATGEIVTAAQLNTHLRDNLEYLKLREDTPLNAFTCNSTTAYTTTAATFTDVDAAGLAGTLTTSGGPLLIGMAGTWKSSGTGIDVCLDVTLNGARIGHATYGVTFLQSVAANLYLPVAWSQVRALAAGVYTLKLQYRTSSGTLSLGPLSATQFYAIELV